jgi:DNA-binding transcriptional MerR regulator
MAAKFLRTSDLARAVGIHPNTVRLYADWGLIPPVERSPAGYRLFTPRHLDCLRLARMIYAAQYPGRGFRALGNAIIQRAVANDWTGALAKAHDHLAAVSVELEQAHQAANLLEHWAQNRSDSSPHEEPLAIGQVAERLGVSIDVIRNWERNGLIRVLGRAGYSHMAMLRMFIELDAGNTRGLKKVLDTPRPDEDIFTAADRWLTTLHRQEEMAQKVIRYIEEKLSAGPA